MSDQSQVLKFGAVVLENLPELPKGTLQWWIEHPVNLRMFLRWLEKRDIPEFPVWKTISLGTGLKDAYDFVHAMANKGAVINYWAYRLLQHPDFGVMAVKTEVDLVNVGGSDLDLFGCVLLEDILKRAQEYGLYTCTPEVGPQLLLQLAILPKNTTLSIGMLPMKHADGSYGIFGVESTDAGLRLQNVFTGPDHKWYASTMRWIFVRPRRQAVPASAG